MVRLDAPDMQLPALSIISHRIRFHQAGQFTHRAISFCSIGGGRDAPFLLHQKIELPGFLKAAS